MQNMDCDSGDDSRSMVELAAGVINGMAQEYIGLRRRSGVKAFKCAMTIGAAVEKLHDMHGDGLFEFLDHDAIAAFYPSRLPEKDGYKYPWGQLQKDGDHFLWPNPGVNTMTIRQKRASISAAAHHKFGPGVIATKIVPSGILVTRIK